MVMPSNEVDITEVNLGDLVDQLSKSGRAGVSSNANNDDTPTATM